MQTVNNIPQMQKLIQRARLQKKSIGFVPTMGFLHEGHLSLIRRSKADNDLTVMSIFVNPKQFSVNEDFSKYPRDFKKDELLAKKENVDIMFYPSAEEMYPKGHATHVEVEGMDRVLCGPFRPGHFRGVTTVVAKLMSIITADTLYLGQKDAQQAVIVSRMAEDLNFPVKIKVMPTVREKNGLAMSSRNSYLTGEQRDRAAVLFAALSKAKRKILAGEHNAAKIIAQIRATIAEKISDPIDYIECVDAGTLVPLTRLEGQVLIALAVWIGKARLIDNIIVRVK